MSKTSWAVRSGIAVVTCAALAACSGDRKSDTAGTADTSGAAMSSTGQSSTTNATASGEATTSAPLSDANILALISEANNAEIQAAQMALTKASNARVRSFAQRMLHDHRQMQAEGDRVSKAIAATPQAPATDSLASHVQQEQAQLSSLSKGPDFDRAYVNAQVTDHQTVVAMLKQFQTAAQHEELKSAITKTIPKVESHLDAALKLQSTLGSTA